MSLIIRAMTSDGSARIIAEDGRDTVNEAIRIHKTTPVCTAALGRTLMASSMMGIMLKDKSDALTVVFRGDGPCGKIMVSSDWMGNVRGCIGNPNVVLPLRSDGKLDVGRAVGKGEMNVLRDLNDTGPYSGISEIVSGEIAEDIASYYVKSEQIPTLCALGVLVDTDYTCLAAGGIMIQLLPFADESIIDIIEKNLSELPQLTTLLKEHPIEEVLKMYLKGIEYEIFDENECGYECKCSRDKTDRALISLGKEELEKMLESKDNTELSCQFCNKKYVYTKSDIRHLISICR